MSGRLVRGLVMVACEDVLAPREKLAKSSRKAREKLVHSRDMSCEMLAADFSGRKMTKTTLTSRFLAGFEPIVLPPRGPDGLVPAGPHPMSLPVLPPSLCEAGPCRNYHRIVSVMEAQDPIGGVGPTRRQVTRACYPHAGVEVELGETPVLQCSRWEPDGEQERLDGIRSRYMRSAPGKAFAEQVAKFEDDAWRRSEKSDADSVTTKQPDDWEADDGLAELEAEAEAGIRSGRAVTP